MSYKIIYLFWNQVSVSSSPQWKALASDKRTRGNVHVNDVTARYSIRQFQTRQDGILYIYFINADYFERSVVLSLFDVRHIGSIFVDIGANII